MISNNTEGGIFRFIDLSFAISNNNLNAMIYQYARPRRRSERVISVKITQFGFITPSFFLLSIYEKNFNNPCAN